MNNRSESRIDWLELDRLVDGRLSDDEYRQLLCQIDADPDGWRHCAMAFLEHQALQKELSAFAADPACDLLALPPATDEMVPEAKVALASTEQENSQGGAAGWLSMAACIVGGLALGFTWQSDFSDNLRRSDSIEITSSGGQAFNGFTNHAAETAVSSDLQHRSEQRKPGSCRRSSPEYKERMKAHSPDWPPCLPMGQKR